MNADAVKKAHVWVRCDALVQARESIRWTLNCEIGTYPRFFQWDYLPPMELWYTTGKGEGKYMDVPMVKITGYA